MKQIQVTFDENEPFLTIAKSANPALPGMPNEPDGWTNSMTASFGIDVEGSTWMWTLQDVDANGVVTLRPCTNAWITNGLSWQLQQSGPSIFPAVTVANQLSPIATPTQAPNTSQANPLALSIVATAAPAVS